MLRTGMKILLLVLLAATASAQKYPPAFPRDGAVKVFENDRVAVWHMVWKNGVKQPVHQSRYDIAGVFLKFGPLTITASDGTTKPSAEPFAVPHPFFQKALTTESEEALNPPGTPEREAVLVELKQKAPAFSNPRAAATRDVATNVLDNDRVTIWDFLYKPGVKPVAAIHDPLKDSIEVFVEGGTVRSLAANGQGETREFAAQEARFVPHGQIQAEMVVAGTPHIMVIELK